MPAIECPFTDCNYTTGETSEPIAIALLNAHVIIHSNNNARPAANNSRVKGPKLERPKIDSGVSTEKWNAFVRRWETFRAGSDIDDASSSLQLFFCAGESLGDIILRAEKNFSSRPFADALQIMKSFAVVPVARGVLRSELSAMRQSADEPFRNFAAKVRGKAETCDFKISCDECDAEVYYTDEAIRDVLLNGIADSDIRRDALGAPDIQTKTVSDVIGLVEGKETARDAHPTPTINASTYRRTQPTSKSSILMPSSNPHGTSPTMSEKSKTATCPDCKKSFHLFTQLRRGWNRTPHQRCYECWQTMNRRPRTTQMAESNAISAYQEDYLGQIAAMTHRSTPEATAMAHQIYKNGEWRHAKIRDHPRINILISSESETENFVNIVAAADTGAQANLWSLSDFLKSGFSRLELSQVDFKINAANNSSIAVEGALIAQIQVKSKNGVLISTKTMIYVSSAVKGFYLSYDTMIELGILDNNFPSASKPVKTNASINDGLSVNLLRAMDAGCTKPHNDSIACQCPQRETVPKRPTSLPFHCVPENNEKMKEWLLQRYASSTFNTCPHRPLPCMTGPPVEIHLDKSAKPRACHTPATVPVHWHQRVYEDLLRDEALGVIERVPYGEPVSWCHRMVVTRKHDGTPRRTVDLSPLNKFCKRETHASETPFHLARRIPRQTWKTVTDAWNGYHSVPLRQSDRHLTTFITPFGRWRYARAPQGFLSSGDGYNRRFDAILTDFQRQERIVDDNIHYDTSLEDHWWRTIDLLSLLGAAGIVLNPDKLQFAQREVDYAGFRISAITELIHCLNFLMPFVTFQLQHQQLTSEVGLV